MDGKVNRRLCSCPWREHPQRYALPERVSNSQSKTRELSHSYCFFCKPSFQCKAPRIEGILQGRCGKYTCTSPWDNYQKNPFQDPWRQAFKHERTTSFPGFSLFLPNKRESPGNEVDERNEVSDVEIEEARNLQNPIMLNDAELRIKFTSFFNGYKRIF